MKKLTNNDYWDGAYHRRKKTALSSFEGLTNHCNRLILEALLKTDMVGKRILEIGAGDSYWLPHLAKKFPTSHFTGLDYSEIGCDLLRERARKANVNIEVICADMFADDTTASESFDIVMSFGVVEHFDDLRNVMMTQKKFLKQDGLIFTMIPNMAGILGILTKAFNEEVYLKHNPHDYNSFSKGHRLAGLELLSGGYLGSSNFAVLSSCFGDTNNGFARQIGRALTATTLVSWWIEQRTRLFPTSKLMSPYIIATSRPSTNTSIANLI